MPLNIGRGARRTVGDRRERLETAYGSCNGVNAVIDAEAAGYIPGGGGRTGWPRADGICARLYRTTHR